MRAAPGKVGPSASPDRRAGAWQRFGSALNAHTHLHCCVTVGVFSLAAADLARWGHAGGFSLHAAVRVEAEDRAGLERLSWDGSDQPVRHSLIKPLPTGQTELTLAPLELLDRLAALIPA